MEGKIRAEGSPAPVLVVDGFSKSYGGKKVVEGVSLSVGSGSNLRLRRAQRRRQDHAHPLDRGRARLRRRRHPHLRAVGPHRSRGVQEGDRYVPDNPDVYGFLTGMQYLDYVADLFGVGGDVRPERISAYAGRLGIEGRLGEMASAYSHGMRQKLVLTGAFLHEPRLLLYTYIYSIPRPPTSCAP